MTKRIRVKVTARNVGRRIAVTTSVNGRSKTKYY